MERPSELMLKSNFHSCILTMGGRKNDRIIRWASSIIPDLESEIGLKLGREGLIKKLSAWKASLFCRSSLVSSSFSSRGS
jgi:hypothetical protein